MKQYKVLTQKDKWFSGKFNKTDNKIRTVYFLFLMKAGFNGVYRENSKGKFNVPFGKKEYIRIDYDNLKHISDLIQNVEFYNLEYQELFKILKTKKIIKSDGNLLGKKTFVSKNSKTTCNFIVCVVK